MSTWTLSDESFRLLAEVRHVVERKLDAVHMRCLDVVQACIDSGFDPETPTDAHPITEAIRNLLQELDGAVHRGEE